MSRRVAFLVCHLSGSGHLARTLALARAVAAQGGAATVITGGRPLPHLEERGAQLVQLPPLAVRDHDYAVLRRPDGAPADAAWMADRRAALDAALADAAPDVLVTELHPFGRRSLRAEFDAAVAAARARGAPVWASVRDIPEPPRKPDRAVKAHARLRADFAGVLVHGDPAVAPFSLGWPAAAEIADLLRHTGYVADPPPPPAGDPDEVLVAEGGGALGRRLLDAALEAARLSDGRPWRLRVGGADAEAHAAALTARAGGAPVIVEPAAADYRARLGACAASVSLLGYGTATDLLSSGAPAVVTPMTDGGQREQALRAEAFARLPGLRVLAPDALSPPALASAVADAVAQGRGARRLARLDGAETSARILLGRAA